MLNSHTHTAGPVTPQGQFCSTCGKELMSKEEIRVMKKFGKESFKEGELVMEKDGVFELMQE